MKDVFKDLWPLIALFLGFFVLWIVLGGPEGRFTAGGGTSEGGVSSFRFLPSVQLVPADRGSGGISSGGSGTRGTGSTGGTQSLPPGISPYSGLVRMQSGNASSASDPDREYITLSMYRSDIPIDITGWTLRNNRDEPIRRGPDEINYTTSESVTIGLGARIVSNRGEAGGDRIIVPPRGRAIVVTGDGPDAFPALINTSFLETKCTGYLSQTERFTPGLYARCESPRSEPGINNISEACYDFISSRARSCRTPSEKSMEELSNQCRAFIKDHFTYQGCVAYHQFDEDFFGTVWRVYLRRSTELWARSRETISLFDAQGLLVDQISYR